MTHNSRPLNTLCASFPNGMDKGRCHRNAQPPLDRQKRKHSPLREAQWKWPLACLHFLTIVVFALHLAGCHEEGALLAKGKKARLPLVIAPESPETLRESAQTLATYLEKISGAKFEIRESKDASSGIILGTADQFPEWAGEFKAVAEDSLRREAYILRSAKDSLFLIGATDLAVDRAVWDLLHRLGYRQYFPGDEWEIIPKRPTLSMDVNTLEEPAYIVRSIWFGFGTWKENAARFRQWNQRNRMSDRSSEKEFHLNTGHAYDTIIAKLKTEIQEDPDILCQVNGKATNKLNAANPRIQGLVVKIKIKEVEELRTQGRPVDSVSMDPSDGGGWGQSPEEWAIGSPSDRVVLLANRVAEALKEKFGNIYVGIYAYNEHATAPKKQRVHPNVIVSFATAFIKGNHTLTENIAAWREAGLNMFGIRDYFSVYAWDADNPAFPRASQLNTLAKNIRDFHGKGARFYSAESSDNWGPCGLGYYLASRLLWDPQENITPDSLIAEFTGNCFPEARSEMETFYRKFLHPSKRLNPNKVLLGDMFRQLDAALRKTREPSARKRLQSLILYTAHLENMLRYNQAGQDEKPKAFEDMLRFSWRIHNTGMVHSLAHWRSHQGARQLKVSGMQIPEKALWNVQPPENPWKDDAPFDDEEIQTLLQKGIANNPPLEFEEVNFSRDLIPATGIPGLDKDPGKEFQLLFRGAVPIFTLIEDSGQPLQVTAAGGQIYQNLGDAQCALFYQGEDAAPLPLTEEAPEEAPLYEPAADHASIPPDKAPHVITLRAQKKGRHALLLKDRSAGTLLKWPADRHFTMEYSLERAPGHMYRYRMVFYVPKGAKYLGGFASGGGRILNAAGDVKMLLRNRNEFFKVPVEEGESGTCWTFESANGTIRLMTAPPYMAPSAAQLLLPREVVEADSK